TASRNEGSAQRRGEVPQLALAERASYTQPFLRPIEILVSPGRIDVADVTATQYGTFKRLLGAMPRFGEQQLIAEPAVTSVTLPDRLDPALVPIGIGREAAEMPLHLNWRQVVARERNEADRHRRRPRSFVSRTQCSRSRSRDQIERFGSGSLQQRDRTRPL